MIDAIYRRLMDRDFALEDPEVVMLLTALINILGHDNRGDRPTEVLLMAAYGVRGVLDRPNMRVMRWRNGALSGSDLANEPELGSSRTYQPGEMPMQSKPKPGLTRMHQEMRSEAASSGSPLREAVPPKRAKVGQKVQTNQTMQDLDGMKDKLERAKRELDEMTKTYGTIDDTGRVRLSQTVIRQGISDVTPLMGSSKAPERRIQKMPAKKVSRVIDVQNNNQLRYNFTGVPETDPRACFNRATWNPAVNLQQPPLGTSHLILVDSLVRLLSNLRTSWVTTVMAFGGATIAQLYRKVELMNPGRIPNVMILVGTNDISRGSDEQEALWESMMVCLFTTLWQKFNCAVLTVCTVPMNTRSLTAAGRRHNEERRSSQLE